MGSDVVASHRAECYPVLVNFATHTCLHGKGALRFTWACVADQCSSGAGRQAVHHRVFCQREALQGGQHRQHADVSHMCQAIARQPQLSKQRQPCSAGHGHMTLRELHV
jgi:hypothetical protein